MKDPQRFVLALQNCEGRLDYKTLTAKSKIIEEIPTEGKKKQIRPIVQCQDGQFVAQYASINEAAKVTGCKTSSIWRVLKGKKNSTGGFEWYYA